MVELKIRLDWSEMDMFQHINNVSYFKFTQANRLQILDEVGLTESFNKTKIGPTLAHTSCDFKKELNYPGNVIVRSVVTNIKNTSFIIAHQLYNDNEELCAEAQDVIVVFDYQRKEKHQIAETLKERLLKIR